MATAKEIKTRLKSIKNTKKITKAMELVAAAKMRRAIERTTQSKAYSQQLFDLAQRLSANISITPDDSLYPFFQGQQKSDKILLILFTSNRGLCGAFNSNLVKKVAKFAKGKDIEVIGIGKKGVTMLSSFGIQSSQAYEKDDSASDASSIVNITQLSYRQYKEGKYGKVLVAYTDFQSSLVQEPTIKQLYPISFDDTIAEAAVGEIESEPNEQLLQYVYEPSARDVLAYLVPRFAQSQLYQALLESNASEHSSRMLAMKNASESAGEMLNDLTLEFNRARQASITQEISEISAGMAAVS